MIWLLSLVTGLVFTCAYGEPAKKESPPAANAGQACITCHQTSSPGIVTDWRASRHAENSVGCIDCHGTRHLSAEDADKAGVAGPETCHACHENQVIRFKAGKHALAWQAAKNAPNFPHISRTMMEGGKGCGGCHKFGIKDETELGVFESAGSGTQAASCDACHTRHTFSRKEALAPQACQSCHQGDDHPQWLMYEGSKHGVRSKLKQLAILPENATAPTCQSCHMPDGDHYVMTAWGFFGLRLPLSQDAQWAAAQRTILRALGMMDRDGNLTPAMDGAKALSFFRFSEEQWQKERDKMIKICSECHATSFAEKEHAKADALLREADKLMAEAIRIVAALYEDGIVEKPAGDADAFPQLLSFHDARNPAEEKLFEMFLDHRPLVYMGAFHNNPEYPVWYGFASMKADLYEIKEAAAALRGKQ